VSNEHTYRAIERNLQLIHGLVPQLEVSAIWILNNASKLPGEEWGLEILDLCEGQLQKIVKNLRRVEEQCLLIVLQETLLVQWNLIYYPINLFQGRSEHKAEELTILPPVGELLVKEAHFQ
jgi:hypothetical protein